MVNIDEIALNFNPTSLFILNCILGLVMFGVALDMRLDDFWQIRDRPISFLIGMLCQFVILPIITFMMVIVIGPAPSVGLGMILVASCPGGNISNFFTYLGKGNAALSVGMSAVSTLAAMVMTPFNFAFWGARVPGAEPILSQIALDPIDMAITIFILMGLPLAVGMFINHRFPGVSARLRGPMKTFSMVFFIGFVILALAANWANFVNYVSLVFIIIMVMNGIALLIGYTGATLARLPERDRRAIAIEVGIQNSGLGLILIFNFFGGLGGMAIIAAWWGIWHIITGYALGYVWSHFDPDPITPVAAA